MYEQYDTGRLYTLSQETNGSNSVEENPNMMYMLVGSYATPEEEGYQGL